MKLIFIVSVFCTTCAWAQYEPTLADMAGNGPTADGRGYVNQFGGDFRSNCFYSVLNDSYNQSGSVNYSYVLDTLNGFYQLSFNGKQENTEVLCNHFTAGNCEFLENTPGGYLNLSNPLHHTIEIKVKSTVKIERFGVLIVVNDQTMVFHLGDGAEHAPVELLPGKWKVLKIPLSFERWDSMALDPTRVMGIAFYARNTVGPQPVGKVDIDYIRVGSAVKKNVGSGAPSATMQGYAFTFKGDEYHTCTRQFNTTGNPHLQLDVNQASHQATLTQLITPSRYDIFGLEFTDEDCFLKTISLKEEKNRFVEIKIKPETDILSFGISISGKGIENKLWNYSNVVEYVTLKGGTWNTLKVPVTFDTQTGGKLNPARIGGVVFAMNPHSENETADSALPSVQYVIEYIKIGDAILVK